MYAAQEQGDTAPILPSSSTHSLWLSGFLFSL
jgi:hypothetical protein